VLNVSATPIVGSAPPQAQTFEAARDLLAASYAEWESTCASVTTGSSVFDDLLNRGRRDLRALLTPTPHGPVYAAGIPWYVTIFGRDSIFAAFQTLMLNPEPARNTLRCLAAYQGRQVDPWRDEEPGKILHELRQGELAGAGYVPHTPYYGTVDATPLFCVLYGSYFRWTGDLELARELLPNAEAALAWIEQYGDSNGDGWVDYRRRSPRGLLNQGWKDSNDSVVHEDGRLAPSPIALAEVQAYVHLARLRMADVYDGLGRSDDARHQRALATELRTRFNDEFWVEEKGYFAEAIDGEGKQVTTVTTNPAHGLYGGFIDPDKAAIMAKRLMAGDMFSGWGIRTMSEEASAYNPISYHDGSIWPHDNAFIAAGLKRYDEREATNRVATAIVDAASATHDRRLPELYCGFSRDGAGRPVSYPVACAPQAWAAGAPFQLLQAMLGISARADEGMLTVNRPMLPQWLRRVTLSNIRVGDAKLSLEFSRNREGDPTSFVMLERHGNVRVVMEE
jgi:glycogen debranching enzyme